MYWKIGTLIIIGYFWFGIIGPNMVSAKSDVLPTLWMVLTFVFVGLIIGLWNRKKIYKVLGKILKW